MFRAVGDGRIKAIWIMATNPVDSMPEADTCAPRSSLPVCCGLRRGPAHRYNRSRACFAAISGMGRKDGTVTNSERRISRQRAFLEAPGEARADWWQMAEIGRRLGFAPQFGWSTARDIFTEYAQLTSSGNSGQRDLDLGDLADLTSHEYDSLRRCNGRGRGHAFSAMAIFSHRITKRSSFQHPIASPPLPSVQPIHLFSTPAAFATSGTP